MRTGGFRMTRIHDHDLPPLEPDLSGWQPVVVAIRKQIAQKREEQNMQPIDFAAARAQRDAGMQQATNHADEVNEDWSEQAYDFLIAFAQRNHTFQSEDVSDASKRVSNFPQPPTDRAWGSVYTRAARAGVIEQYGMARSRRRHASVCILWLSLVFGGNVA